MKETVAIINKRLDRMQRISLWAERIIIGVLVVANVWWWFFVYPFITKGGV